MFQIPIRLVAIAGALLIGACSQQEQGVVPLPTSGEVAQSIADNARREAQKEEERKKLYSEMTREGWSPGARMGRAKRLMAEFPDTPEAEHAKEVVETIEAYEFARDEAAAANGKWSYNQSSDPMTKGITKTARLQSENSLSLDFPYQGEQKATLIVRNHPQFGNDVIFRIEKGQILCRTYDCSVTVAFDDGAPFSVKGSPSSDHDSTFVFLRGYSRLTKQIASASEMRVQVSIYQYGAPTLIFDVEGFNRSLEPTSSTVPYPEIVPRDFDAEDAQAVEGE